MSDDSRRLASLSPEKLRLLEQRLGTASQIAEPIAIVGMSCRFAGAPDLDAYWRVISRGIDAIDEIAADRWNIAEFYDPSGEQLVRMLVSRGGMVGGADGFYAAVFGISPMV